MIALGTPVKFTEVAFVVRKPAKSDGRWEAPRKGNYDAPSMEGWDDEGTCDGLFKHSGRFLAPVERTNKNVLAVPSEGSGVVIGLERKFAGKSVSGRSRSTLDGDDWEPGWFEPKGGPLDLYVVKSELRGKAFYVPPDALEVLA